ncbi:MAG: hypothetical protein WAN35_06640 [Terracidiphilus sp.]
MLPHHRRILFLAGITTLLFITACRQKAHEIKAISTHPAPYKVYQGTGEFGEEKGGRVCFIYGNAEHCWNAGDGFNEVKAKPIKLPSGGRLLLVTALSMGGSDGTLDLALLDEQNQQPVNLLPRIELDSANAGQWDDLLIEDFSAMPIIVSADPVWSDDHITNTEDRGRYHQFALKAYFYDKATGRYTGPIRYLTSRKYSSSKNVIALEKPNILAVLKGAAMK